MTIAHSAAVMHYCDAILCAHGSCSKSFGESTPSGRPYRAHRSPNSPISPRLVKAPPSRKAYRAHRSPNDLEQCYSEPFVALSGGLCGPFRPVFPSRFSRCVTSGRKAAFHAVLAPDLSHQEMARQFLLFGKNFIYFVRK